MSPDSLADSLSWPDAFDDDARAHDAASELAQLREKLAGRAPPTGRFARFWALSSLPAKLAAAYAFGWTRAHFAPADERELVRAETHWRAALHALGTMGYLRGAVAKAGQTIASYPSIAPRQMLELLAELHAEAPPMHFALLRELVRGELGGEPDELFEHFDAVAFAAASIGQVHRAKLQGGCDVAVKVQYPGIARAIRADLANVRLLVTPLRLGSDWDNLVAQLDELALGLERETDYLREALWTERARAHLADLSDVVVPRVIESRSTSRVLTTEFLPGRHLDAFVASEPSQAARDRHGEALTRAAFRLWSTHRMLNTDPGPGNVLFLDDGRTGLIDFGSCRAFDAAEWELMVLGVRAAREGGAAQRECIERTSLAGERPLAPESFAQRNAMCGWLWEPLRATGRFDFGDDAFIARGIQLFGQSLRNADTRQMPVFVWCMRQFFGLRALLWALKARIDFRAIAEEEYRRAGI